MTEATEERWLPVVGYEGAYEVSDLGRVRSFVHKNVRILRPGIASNGYPSVALKGRTHFIHHLVLAAFRGPRPEGLCARHLNGDRRDGRLLNLEYGTYAENSADAAAHGTRCRGERYRNAKLTDGAVRVIRKLKGVVSQEQLAEFFRVSPAAVQAVHDGRTWTHVR